MEILFRDLNGQHRRLVVRDGCWAEPDGSSSIDMTAGWAIAGLVDAHAHLSTDPGVFAESEVTAIRHRSFAAMQAGVFLCLDKGWSDDLVMRVIYDSPETSPTIEAAGRMIAGRGGYFTDFAQEVAPDELASAAAAQAAKQGGWVKIVGDWPRKGKGPQSSFDEESLRAAVDVAHKAGARVAIHSMAGSASDAVAAGVDSIEHGLFLTESDIRQLASRSGTWVPTILRMEAVLEEMRPGSSGAKVLFDGLANVKDMLPLAQECGLTVLAGTDMAVAVSEVWREVERLVEYGLDADVAIRSATLDGVGGASSSSLSVGEPADLVVFDGDPREDPALLGRPVVVLRHGHVVTDHRGWFADQK